jgi:hypothetical protein
VVQDIVKAAVVRETIEKLANGSFGRLHKCSL